MTYGYFRVQIYDTIGCKNLTENIQKKLVDLFAVRNKQVYIL